MKKRVSICKIAILTPLINEYPVKVNMLLKFFGSVLKSVCCFHMPTRSALLNLGIIKVSVNDPAEQRCK